MLAKISLRSLLKKIFCPIPPTFLILANAVQDVTERNPAENVRIAFSTGQHIDTLFVSGKVRNALSREPLLSATVALYNSDDTLDILKDKPMYYTKTDSAGYYRLDNLKTGSYTIYGLAEPSKKANLKYDSETDLIAFLEEPMSLKRESRAGINLFAEYFDRKKFRIASARPQRGYFFVNANKVITECRIDFEEKSLADSFPYKIEGESVRFYNLSGTATDSIPLKLTLFDSLKTEIEWEGKIIFDDLPESSSRRKAAAFAILTEPAVGTTFNAGEKLNLTLIFSKPVAEFFPDSITFRRDKDTADNRISAEKYRLNSTKTRLKILEEFSFEKQIKFNLRTGSFYSTENDTSKTRPLMYSVKDESKTGGLRGLVRTSAENFILEVLDEKYVLEQSLKNPSKFEFKFVKPGKKKLRLIIDANGNGKWDGADFDERRRAETVYIFEPEAELKPGWIIEDILIDPSIL